MDKMLDVPQIPDFSLAVQAIQREDPVHYQQMNQILTRLLTNDAYLHQKPYQVTLMADGWSDTEPFAQTVDVEGIRETDELLMLKALPEGSSAEEQKAYDKAFAIVSSGDGVTGNGSVTITIHKKPTIDIIIGLKPI